MQKIWYRVNGRLYRIENLEKAYVRAGADLFSIVAISPAPSMSPPPSDYSGTPLVRKASKIFSLFFVFSPKIFQEKQFQIKSTG